MQKCTLIISLCLCVNIISAQNKSTHGNKFEQLDYLVQSPNEYRTASGAPGPKYWQQRADYDITAALDEKNKRITGSETITYYNNSPNSLTYIWLQLDENEHDPKSDNNHFNESSIQPTMTEADLYRLEPWRQLETLGDKITQLTDAAGKPLKYIINQTMMRIELPQTLKPGQSFIFKVDWNYTIPNRFVTGGRGGYEYFPEDGNCLFTITQWYPRLCVYSDFQGWQNHQFTGTGEFALTFGNFKVKMTVPADHIVAATGECKNYNQILSSNQLARWKQAQNVKEPLAITTLEEATTAEKQQNTTTKTWVFEANNVRDFAWGSSRKFIWDAMPTYIEGKKIMCMSFYPKESYSLYKKYSTKVIAHTIQTYSAHTIPYPYPVAQSVEAANGMEYPMICFNFGRTEKDGTYSAATKYGMIGVVIHEVGHNFFPMIINSDERQWTWMDEGLNSFCEYLTEQAFDNNY
nr:M1 family metallopeptidase [Chitinophagaceae bacterium]